MRSQENYCRPRTQGSLWGIGPQVLGRKGAAMASWPWDARYAEPEFAYGTEPNDFLAQAAAAIPPGPVLSLAEGQGRNAVWLAGRGYAVEAVDASAVGLARAQEL